MNKSDLFNFKELNSIIESDKFIFLQRVLALRLLGLSEFNIQRTMADLVEINDIREAIKEVDLWIKNNVTQASEFINEKDIEKILQIKKIDYIIAERCVLLNEEPNVSNRNRIITSMRDDLRLRFELNGLLSKQTKNEVSIDLDLPEITFNEETLKQIVSSLKENEH